MTFKDKIILVILTLLTLGLYPLFVFKKKNKEVNTKLKTSSKIKIDMNKLREFLGGTDNIAGAEYTQKKTKIYIKDKSKIVIEEVQKLKGISGVFSGTNYVTIIVGDSAKAIAKSI